MSCNQGSESEKSEDESGIRQIGPNTRVIPAEEVPAEPGEITPQTNPEDYLSPQEILNEKGFNITKQARQELLRTLIKTVREKGVTGAIEYCNLAALPMLDSMSKAEDVEISRVSHRPRNPANDANDDESGMITYYMNQQKEQGSMAPVMHEMEDYIYHVSPILLKEMVCLKCHGEKGKDIAAEDYIAISLSYPNDQATGYKRNEIMGLWIAKFRRDQVFN